MKHYLILDKEEDGSYSTRTDDAFGNPAGYDVSFKITNEGRAILVLSERINR